MKTVIELAREAGAIHIHKSPKEFAVVGNEAIERFAELVRADERRAMMQLFTDPENQPTQHGTVTVEYMQREIAAERERFALECIDLVALHGGPVDLEAAIRARGNT